MIMKEINGKKYSDAELRDIYKFFTNCGLDREALPSYGCLVKVGFNKDSKECTDLVDTYEKLSKYDKIMSETHGKAYELATMYRDFKSCLPIFLDDRGEQVATASGWKLKELEECDDKELIESIQKMYDKLMKKKLELLKKYSENI